MIGGFCVEPGTLRISGHGHPGFVDFQTLHHLSEVHTAMKYFADFFDEKDTDGKIRKLEPYVRSLYSRVIDSEGIHHSTDSYPISTSVSTLLVILKCPSTKLTL